ncbi:lipase family protein [Sphingosinicellaceae bacterium]|nr:lipase family protein [Sphingosinicellaceae bacterium]
MSIRTVAIVASLGLATPVYAVPPGSIVGSVPLAGAPSGASATRIHYRSTDADGRPVTVTAAIVIPRGRAPTGGRNIVVWAHGATGVAESCGLSDKPGVFAQVAGLDTLMAAGDIVVAPDYQGLGSPGPHPFLVGLAAAHSVIDAARAARAMPGVKTSGHYAVFGESLGGFSALWTGSEAARYAPEMTLVGVAAAAPPTDLKANLTEGSAAAVRAFLTAYTATSWEQVYHLPVTTVVKPRSASLIRALAKNCVALDGFKLRTKIGMLRLAAQLKGVDLAANPRWAALMEQNSVPAGLTVPAFVAQGAEDVIVAPAVTRKYVDRLCRAKVSVRYVAMPGNHVTAGKASAPQAAAWIADRFVGKPAPNDCARL